MNLDFKLPSNRKFGFFFSGIFFIFGVYLLYIQSIIVASILIVGALAFIFITLIKADLLLPLNRVWMRFGQLLGMIISPFVMGIIFFGLITPYAVFMRIIGRDELRLKQITNKSHWILRSQGSPQTEFNKQF
jgi:hypothetical protein